MSLITGADGSVGDHNINKLIDAQAVVVTALQKALLEAVRAPHAAKDTAIALGVTLDKYQTLVGVARQLYLQHHPSA